MAAIQLSKPGTKYGPCKADCQHRDCAATRAMATSICRYCQKAIGYATRFYADPDSTDRAAMVHADCLHEAFEQELKARGETTPAPEPRKGEYLIPAGARDGACRSCGAPVLWITTAKGSAMPLSVATIEARDGERYALSHFGDCPQAKGWSKK